MGWFLHKFSHTNKAGQGSAAKRSSARPSWDPQRSLSRLRATFAFLAVVAVILAWRGGRSYLEDFVRDTTLAANARPAVTLAQHPDWLDAVPVVAARSRGSLSERITGEIARLASADPVNRRELIHVAQYLEREPWVQRIRQVRRGPGGQIEVDADFRTPAAIVEARDGYHLVDHDAVRLPGVYAWEHLHPLRIPVIIGATTAPPTTGSRWRGQAVLDGVKLARVIIRQPFAGQVQAIDISARDRRDRVQLVLHTRADHAAPGLVYWGLAPGDAAPIEPETGVKLSRLLDLYHSPEYGSIDAGGQVVMVNGPRTFIRRTHPDAAASRGYTSR